MGNIYAAVGIEKRAKKTIKKSVKSRLNRKIRLFFSRSGAFSYVAIIAQLIRIVYVGTGKERKREVPVNLLQKHSVETVIESKLILISIFLCLKKKKNKHFVL